MMHTSGLPSSPITPEVEPKRLKKTQSFYCARFGAAFFPYDF